jgi:hypothetical protein
MHIANPKANRNGETEKVPDLIRNDDLAATLIATKFALSILHARVIIALAGIGSGVQR